MNPFVEEKLKNLPNNPGVYQFMDKQGKVIYVGKAKNLKNRVRSYFQSNVDSIKTKTLVSKIENFELIITDSEIEALVLENNLIKDLKPRYNINLKDDKSFPYIRVTNEPYPQIFSTRYIVRDGSKYFGPYTDVKNMKASLRMINKLFKIRSCKYLINEDSIEAGKIKVCLDYHIKKCDGPCEGRISEKAYNEMVHQVIQLLKGKTGELIKDLQLKMAEEAKKMNFEYAAELRDKIDQLTVYSEKQKIVTENLDDRDIISAVVEDKDVACVILNIRGGKLLSKKQFRLSSEIGESLENVYNAIIKFYYNEYVETPKEIILDIIPDDIESLTNWLSEKLGRKIKFVVPQRKSDTLLLLKMCKQNAILLLKEIQLQRMKREGTTPHVLQSLKRDVHLREIPKRIECFDISNLQGTDTVASMVVFVDGKPKKSEYRKFIIKDVEGPDDFASMREVIQRRYGRLVKEEAPLPELIMVDGGKGQLSSAVEILNDLGLQSQEIIGLAKRLEEVFLPGDSEPQTIPRTSSSLKLLQHVRDEAHRFAITFHRSRRDKRTFTTELTEIPGIGEKIAEKLLSNFESVEAIKNASISDLSKHIGLGKAKAVIDYYNK